MQTNKVGYQPNFQATIKPSKIFNKMKRIEITAGRGRELNMALKELDNLPFKDELIYGCRDSYPRAHALINPKNNELFKLSGKSLSEALLNFVKNAGSPEHIEFFKKIKRNPLNSEWIFKSYTMS